MQPFWETGRQYLLRLFRHVPCDSVILVPDEYPKNRKAQICVSKDAYKVREMAGNNLKCIDSSLNNVIMCWQEYYRGSRGGSAVESTCRRPGFGSQHPHDSSQLPTTQFSGIQRRLLTFLGS